MKEYLTLKWGTLKGWKVDSEASREKCRAFLDMKTSLGTMTEPNSPEKRQALCELIDVIDGSIENGWTGETYTKEQAKAYVMEYQT